MSSADSRPRFIAASRRCLIALSLLVCAAMLQVETVHGVTGTHRTVLIQVRYTDTAGPTYTLHELTLAAGEMSSFFRELSYGNLDLRIQVTEVGLPAASSAYLTTCTPDDWSGCSRLLRDLIGPAESTVDFTGVNSILVINPGCGGGFTHPSAIDARAEGRDRSFNVAFDTQCVGDPARAPGPSGVSWGGWAHELGHILEQSSRITLDAPWLGHPTNYSSGYDLMDSCYPCHGSAFSLLHSGSPREVFPGWLSPSKVVTVGVREPGTTVVLAPLSQDSATTTAPQAIKIPISAGTYYMVEARRRIGTDARDRGRATPGIWDEGLRIQRIEESANPPAANVEACDTTVPGGCVRTLSDPRAATCSAPGGAAPGYCWPFHLWHVGEAFTDSANNIRIRVDEEVGNGYAVTVIRGPATARPDVLVLPWLTPPMNQYESVDIWVDSSCNGYEALIGPAGLREGRRADGTVIGNGDDPCANHRNRVYARVRNAGDAAADDVRVTFRVTDPPGVGIRDPRDWIDIGTVTAATFPELASIPPGGSVEVYVDWVPRVELSDAEIGARRFAFHTCLQVKVEPVAGEVVRSNQDGDGEQENISYFEARRPLWSSVYDPAYGEFYIRNIFGKNDGAGRQAYELHIESDLPPGWSYSVGDGQTTLFLEPDEVRLIPVKVLPPPDALPGQSYSLKVSATTNISTSNPAAEASGFTAPPHEVMGRVAGVMLTARAVETSRLEVAAKNGQAGEIHVAGSLEPQQPAFITVDLRSADGTLHESVLVVSDSGGRFGHTFTPQAPGPWTVQALWQGDRTNSSAVSKVVTIKSGK